MLSPFRHVGHGHIHNHRRVQKYPYLALVFKCKICIYSASRWPRFSIEMQGQVKFDDNDDESVPQPHKRPQRPTVTSPGWILQSRSVGWNLHYRMKQWNLHDEDESFRLFVKRSHLADLEGCDGRGGAGCTTCCVVKSFQVENELAWVPLGWAFH